MEKKLKLNGRLLWRMTEETLRDWQKDKASRLGAALAFYSILSMGPLLLIVIAIAGMAFGQEAASGHIFAELRGLIGNEGADAIQTVIANSRQESTGFWATLVGVITLFVAATGSFAQLQDALNTIWDVQAPPGRTLMRSIKKRALSFGLVLGIGFLLLVSLIVSAALSAFGDYFFGMVPDAILHVVNMIVSFAVITVLFAMIFKILPDVTVRWRDVWIGSFITAVLFSIGKFAIGMYLGQSALSSTYGAAGSLIVILIWVYYSTQILFLGAEFTQVYANYLGARIVPARGAIPLTKQQRKQQGIPE